MLTFNAVLMTEINFTDLKGAKKRLLPGLTIQVSSIGELACTDANGDGSQAGTGLIGSHGEDSFDILATEFVALN